MKSVIQMMKDEIAAKDEAVATHAAQIEALRAERDALREAGKALAELFRHALETPGYGCSPDDQHEIDAHWRDWESAVTEQVTP